MPQARSPVTSAQTHLRLLEARICARLQVPEVGENTFLELLHVPHRSTCYRKTPFQAISNHHWSVFNAPPIRRSRRTVSAANPSLSHRSPKVAICRNQMVKLVRFGMQRAATVAAAAPIRRKPNDKNEIVHRPAQDRQAGIE